MRVVVLVSGAGSNLQALLDAVRSDPDFGVEVVGVIADHSDAGGLQRAEAAGVDTLVVRWGDHASREDFTGAIVAGAKALGADALILAGFMRVLSREAVSTFPILNIHPALSPAFPGANAVEEALAYGVKTTGVTVHFVDEFVDHGPIIAQEAVDVEPDDTPQSLHERIRKVEHRLYPEVIRAFAKGRLRVDGRVVYWRADD